MPRGNRTEQRMGSVQSSPDPAVGDPDGGPSEEAPPSHGLGHAAASHLLGARRTVRGRLREGDGDGDGAAPLREMSPTLLGRRNDCRGGPAEARLARLDAILSSMPLAAGLGTALLGLAAGPLDDARYLCLVSDLVGASGGGVGTPEVIDLVFEACRPDGGGRCAARDLVGLCLEAARAGHLMAEEGSSAGGTAPPSEDGDGVAAGEVLDSLAASLLSSAGRAREERRRDARPWEPAVPDAGEEDEEEEEDGNDDAPSSVTREEFAGWQRTVLPDLLHCSVSSLVRAILLPPGVSDLAPVRFPTFRSSDEVTSRQVASRLRPGEIVSVLRYRAVVSLSRSPLAL